MKRILKHLPIHSFLIGLYVIIFIFAHNMDKTTFSSTYRSMGIELVVSIILFGISYLIFRSGRKAGIFSTLVLVGFFTYGISYNYLEALYYKGYWPFSHIHRFLIVVYCLRYTFLLIVLYRSQRPHYNLNYILNVFVLVLFALNIPIALISFKKENTNDQRSNPYLAINNLGYQNISTADSSFPDIYYIILDGYAEEKTLQEFYSDAKPVLYNYFRGKGFYIADSSRANYPFTVSSLSSSLNMGYLDAKDINAIPHELIRSNTVNHVFKKAGYRVVNLESGYAVTEGLSSIDKTIGINALNEFENRLLQLTILRLDDVLGFSNYMRLKSEVDQLKDVMNVKGPKFSFIHLVCPHPPYVVDSSGKRTIRSSVTDMSWEPRKDYWNQLQYVSKKLMNFIDLLLSNSKRPPVIIVQSDHGPWIKDSNPESVYNARSRILNAYYVPDAIKKNLYPTITPVNSFRVIFSDLLKANFPVVPDHPYPFSKLKEDVTFKKYNQ